MPAEKLSVSWDEIESPKVDERLKLLNTAARGPQAPPPDALAPVKRGSLLYNTVFYMSCFGLLGGLLGWGIGEGLNFRGNALDEASEHYASRQQIQTLIDNGTFSPDQGAAAQKVVDDEERDNPYYQIDIDTTLSPEEKEARQSQVSSKDEWKDFLSDLLFYGVSGMTIAVCLGIAEPAVERNWRGVVINGSVAAVLGLIGGVVVALFISRFQNFIVKSIADAQSQWVREMISNSVQWGTLGLFLGIAPGVVLKSGRKILAGATGGLIGGLAGGALIEVVKQASDNNQNISRLVAIGTIGLVAGLGTGLIENAVKSGWLKVTAGLIAGKQFILYRDPTFIGSALSCHIYLFRDPSVGKRHAAIHIVPGGFEIENLPLGTATLVNNEQVEGRRKLRNGDRIQIGTTSMVFQEKVKS
jgi:hypothetical protein